LSSFAKWPVIVRRWLGGVGGTKIILLEEYDLLVKKIVAGFFDVYLTASRTIRIASAFGL
jgi:hypothetical protein